MWVEISLVHVHYTYIIKVIWQVIWRFGFRSRSYTLSPESFWLPVEENILIQVSDLLRAASGLLTWVELLTNKDTGADSGGNLLGV